MKAYFQLQYRMINRHLAGFGLQPVLGYVISLVVFTGLSAYLFYKTTYASYLYVVIALSLLSRLSETSRNDFLRSLFPGTAYRKLRIVENLIMVLPFALFLIYKLEFIPLFVMGVLSSALAITSFTSPSGYALPTPFGSRPFEFSIGFRNTWPLLFIAFFLAIMAGISGNFNLGVFAQLLLLLVVFSYFLNPEKEFYVWIFNLKPAPFLAAKFRTAWLFSSLLTLPVMIMEGLFFPEKAILMLAILALSWFYLAMVILAKYASFPAEISLPIFILMAFTVTFPPLLVVLIPYLWIKSVHRLKMILA